MVEPRERLSASIYLQIDLEIARMGDLPSDTAPRFGMDLPPMPTRSPRVSSFVAEENALGLMIDPVIDEYLERASTREVGIEVLDRRTFSKLMRDDSTERDPWTLTQKQKDALISSLTIWRVTWRSHGNTLTTNISGTGLDRRAW